METGDLDNTPAPSVRPSLSILRKDKDDVAQSNTSSLGRTSSYRHHLLKTSASGSLIVDKNLPVPPVLSRKSPPNVPKVQGGTDKIEYEDQLHSPRTAESPEASSPVNLPDTGGMSPQIPASQRVCLDPSLHVRETHAHAHHPGLLPGSDFCDTGSASKESAHPWESPGPSSPTSHDELLMQTGEVHQILPDGKVLIKEVEFPVPLNEGHSRAVKVRPAFNHHAAYYPHTLGKAPGIDCQTDRNKVRPFDLNIDESATPTISREEEESSPQIPVSDFTSEIKSISEFDGQSASHETTNETPKVQLDTVLCKTADEEIFAFPPEASVLGQGFEVPVSKVRPFAGNPVAEHYSHEFHLDEGKVRPFSDLESTRALKEQSVLTESPSGVDNLQQYPLHAENLKPFSEGERQQETKESKFDVPISKVRAFQVDYTPPKSKHLHHLHVCKAQPFNETKCLEDAQNFEDKGSVPGVPSSRGFAAGDSRLSEGSNRHATDQRQKSNMAEGNNSNQMSQDTKRPEKPPVESTAEINWAQQYSQYPEYTDPQMHAMDYYMGRPAESDVNHKVSRIENNYSQYASPTQHAFGANYPLEPDIFTAREHAFYPLSTQLGYHDLESCATYPRELAPAIHRVSNDTTYPTIEEMDHHGLQSCSGPTILEDLKCSSVHSLEKARHYSLASKADQDQCNTSPRSVPSLRAEHGNVQRTTSSRQTSRSHSGESGTEYKTTMQWLREFLRYPESYSPKLTQLPERARSNQLPLDKRRISEPLPLDIAPSRQLTGKSIQFGRSDSHIDGAGFKRTVGDLERLLGEALEIASQVVEQPLQTHQQPSDNLHPSFHVHYIDENSRIQGQFSPVSAYERPDEYDLSDVELDDELCAHTSRRPRAVTFSGPLERPRLSEIMKDYPGLDEDLEREQLLIIPPRAAHKISFEIPVRRSSRHYPPHSHTKSHEDKIRQDILAGAQGMICLVDDIACEEAEVVDFDQDIPRSGGRPVQRSVIGQHAPGPTGPYPLTGDDALPDRDFAGRQMHHEHGISLRHRSHVSLRGIQGFSLSKSYKRQPIARD